MNCQRCRGFMVYERIQESSEVIFSWRCVICGDVYDDVVIKNRELNGKDERSRDIFADM